TSLAWVLRHPFATAMVWIATVAVTIGLYILIPKGFFPQQDTGRMAGSIVADQSASFQSMEAKLRQFAKIVGEDPAVENVMAFAGGGASNSARMFVSLKPLNERDANADKVIARLRGKLAKIPG